MSTKKKRSLLQFSDDCCFRTGSNGMCNLAADRVWLAASGHVRRKEWLKSVANYLPYVRKIASEGSGQCNARRSKVVFFCILSSLHTEKNQNTRKWKKNVCFSIGEDESKNVQIRAMLLFWLCRKLAHVYSVAHSNVFSFNFLNVSRQKTNSC